MSSLSMRVMRWSRRAKTPEGQGKGRHHPEVQAGEPAGTQRRDHGGDTENAENVENIAADNVAHRDIRLLFDRRAAISDILSAPVP